MNLGVPHPSRLSRRVGSYDLTLKIFRSALLPHESRDTNPGPPTYLPAANPTIFSIIADANADVPNFVPPVINRSRSYVTLFC
jgi:hypothetical protein